MAHISIQKSNNNDSLSANTPYAFQPQQEPAAQQVSTPVAPQVAPVMMQSSAIDPAVQQSSPKFDIVLTPEEEKEVAMVASSIDLSDSVTVNSYGIDAQKKIASFSDRTLSNIKTKDVGAVSEQLSGLVTQLNNMDKSEPKGFFGKMFKKAESSIEAAKVNYSSVSTNIESIVKNLEQHQCSLVQDIQMFDRMYEINLDYLKELTMYIIAGYQAIDNAKQTTGLELQQRAATSNLPEDAQAYNDFMAKCNRFEKKLYDLELTRNQSLQMAPQIRLLQNNDQALVEKIQTVVMNTIPMWKNQMVISLGLANSQRAMSAQKAVSDATNELMRKNAELLHMGSVAVAQEAERGIIDIETLKMTNQKLIDTITEVQKIQAEGREHRIQAQRDIEEMENNLKRLLLDGSQST